MPKITSIATQLWKNDLNESDDISVPSIIAWMRGNIGNLNNLLGTSFSLNLTTFEIVDQNGNIIDSGAAGIYRYLYMAEYYARQMRRYLGAGNYNVNLAQQVTNAMGGTVRLVDRNQIAQTFLKLKQDTQMVLKELVNKYKFGMQTALDVQGDDIWLSVDGRFWGDWGQLFARDFI
jgi:hypothetical protein